MTRGYDNAGRWTSVQDWNSNTTAFSYDANSNLTTETFQAASGVVDSFTFNASDQMTRATSSKSGSDILPFPATYTRDPANQLASDTSAASGTGSDKYTLLNQLCYAGSSSTNACSSPPTGSIPYTYDAADNLTKKGTVFQAFNNADELCWTASSSAVCASPPSGKTTYQYDTGGNRTGVTPSVGQAQTLTYDQANRLTQYAAASTTSYGYNGDGLRMCKVAGSSTQPCQPGGNTQFLWDVAGSLPLLLNDGTTKYVYGPGGLPLEQISGATTLWYHHDQLGSTRLVTSSTGVSEATYIYDPYGGLASSTGSVTNPFRFAGQYQDPSSTESGYYYLRARYYDASTAQFVALDVKVKSTMQPFSYAAGNPLNLADPSGLWCAGVNLGYFAAAGLGFVFGGSHEFNQGVAVCSNGYVGGITNQGGGAGVGQGEGHTYGDQGANGAIVSAGLGLMWSPNAQAIANNQPGGKYALQGPFEGSTVGAGCDAGATIGYAFAPGPNHVDVYSFGTPVGSTVGAGGAFYPTNTTVDWSLNLGGGWNALKGSVGSLWSGKG